MWFQFPQTQEKKIKEKKIFKVDVNEIDLCQRVPWGSILIMQMQRCELRWDDHTHKQTQHKYKHEHKHDHFVTFTRALYFPFFLKCWFCQKWCVWFFKKVGNWEYAFSKTECVNDFRLHKNLGGKAFLWDSFKTTFFFPKIMRLSI